MNPAWLESTTAWIATHPIAAGALIFLIAFCDALVIVGIDAVAKAERTGSRRGYNEFLQFQFCPTSTARRKRRCIRFCVKFNPVRTCCMRRLDR